MAQDLFNHQTFMVFKGNNVIVIHHGRKPVIEAVVSSRNGCVMVDIEQPVENHRWSGAIDIDYRDELPFVRVRGLSGDDKPEVLPLKFEEGVTVTA